MQHHPEISSGFIPGISSCCVFLNAHNVKTWQLNIGDMHDMQKRYKKKRCANVSDRSAGHCRILQVSAGYCGTLGTPQASTYLVWHLVDSLAVCTAIALNLDVSHTLRMPWNNNQPSILTLRREAKLLSESKGERSQRLLPRGQIYWSASTFVLLNCFICRSDSERRLFVHLYELQITAGNSKNNLGCKLFQC